MKNIESAERAESKEQKSRRISSVSIWVARVSCEAYAITDPSLRPILHIQG